MKFTTWEQVKEAAGLSKEQDHTRYARIYSRWKRGERDQQELFRPPRTGHQTLCGETWEFWARAIRERYGVRWTRFSIRERVRRYRLDHPEAPQEFLLQLLQRAVRQEQERLIQEGSLQVHRTGE